MTNYLDLADLTREWIDLRPMGGYQIIFADPAWSNLGNSVEKPGKSALRHYRTMTVREICDMPVQIIAAKNALLCLWVTAPYAELAFKVVRAWGFKYKSQLCWPKNTVGTGYWARSAHEMLYICRRGNFPCDMPALFPTSIIPGKARGHSRKPDWPQEMVEKRFPFATKTELFARTQRPGWLASGNETDAFNQPQRTDNAEEEPQPHSP